MTDNKPNIAFIGKKIRREPLTRIHNGHRTIELPEDQKRPFYHAEASTIVRLFPLLYKPILKRK
jgi:hypothetical protein